MANIVAIVGRPNVGKSTLFNRLVGMREAIVDPTSGVTRDRHYGKSDWNGVEFSLIDTGGYVEGSDDIFEEEIRKQCLLAMEESDIILFVMDAMDGVSPLDEDVAELMRKSDKPCLIVANKVDNSGLIADAHEFYSLGLGEVYPISAINGAGTGELLDALVSNMDKLEPEEEVNLPRFAVVGRPNVGKSSFINSILGKDRNIVTDVAGTTRDSIYTAFSGFGLEFLLVDTAGLRKKGKVHEDIEFYSVMRSVRAIEHSDVCIVMLDATQGIESQDLNIFGLAAKNKKGVVVVVNKWDLVEKDSNTHIKFAERIREKTAPFTDVPIIFASATEKQRLLKILETAIEVYHTRSRKISTSALNDTMLPIVKNNPPPAIKGKYVQIKFITQLPTTAPSFAFFCNLPQYVRDPYKRFLENQLRKEFGFTGVPVQIFLRKK